MRGLLIGTVVVVATLWGMARWLQPRMAFLRNRGFSVMAVDYGGYGGSSGSPSERGLYRDAEAATGYFNQYLRLPGAPTRLLGTLTWMRGGVLRCAPGSA